ncbi:MAG: peptidase S41 [Anaerolineae bacterium]|nr:peptidase S41 [Anaerolineae bacterium]
MRKRVFVVLFIVLLAALAVVPAFAQDAPAAEIVNDEGGPVVIRGIMAYTDPFFTAGVAQPIVILEDQGGFVVRNKGFLMPLASQIMAQFTSDYFTSPVQFSITLPQTPQGTLNDVDHDGVEETGVQIFTPAYWTNTFGDPFLEERDLYGGGWSNAYAGTRFRTEIGETDEVSGGTYIVFAPDDQQSFPSGFGDDGLLFTDDDPVVTLPAGWTIVNMDTDPFTFDRSSEATIDLVEPEASALDDFSAMTYADAFDAMIEKFRTEYPFTELKGLDWDALSAEFRPRFEAADEANDTDAYLVALQDFLWSIPDVHIGFGPGGAVLDQQFAEATSGGLGFAMRDIEDENNEPLGVQAFFITPGGPAEAAGMQVGATIIELGGQPVDDYVADTIAFSAPFSVEQNARLQQLRYASRSPLGTTVEVTFQNPGDSEPVTVDLTASDETASFSVSSFRFGAQQALVPVDFEVLDSGYGYARITDFFDNTVLTVQLWERLMQTLNDNGVPGLIIDMRQNGGGSGFLADQMAAYLFNESHVLGYGEQYDVDKGEFYRDEERPDVFYLPQESLRYGGEVALLVGPNCVSACEYFSYAAALDGRSDVVGYYSTAGGGGGVQQFAMPEGQFPQMPIGRSVTPDGEVIIEGVGVVPNVEVPVTLANLQNDLAGGDSVLDAAVAHLDSVLGFTSEPAEVVITDGGEIAVGDSVDGEVTVGERMQFTLTAEAAETVTITVSDPDGAFDSYLRVYDADGNLLAENDDIELGVQINSAIEGLELAAGDVIVIEVGTYDDSSAGAFTLTVEAAM